MNEIYRIGKARVLRVRFFQFFMSAVGFGFLWWAWHLAQTYGLSPGDGGVLRPAVQRYAWAALLGAITLFCFVVASEYGRRYVERIEYDPKLRLVWLHTLDAGRLNAPSDLVSVSWQEGRTTAVRRDGAVLDVHAPWWKLDIHGNRRSYIVDALGATIDKPMFERLLSHR